MIDYSKKRLLLKLHYFSSTIIVMVLRILSNVLILREIAFLSSSSESDSTFTMISWYPISLYAYATAGIFLSLSITSSSVPIEQSISMIAVGKGPVIMPFQYDLKSCYIDV